LKLRALVIDDSRVMRNIVMQTLRHTKLAEFEFTEAEDGADGLSKFSAAKTDIVFVDWNMPKMTGIDFVRQLRAASANDQVPIVMVTSEKSMGKVMEATDRAGADAYICKPFTPEELISKLARIFEGLASRKAAGGGFFGRLLGR
jgi:two-component system chemotaxis response regulator CheY